MGLAAGGNGNNRWDWEENENKTLFSLGAAMGMGNQPLGTGGNTIEKEQSRSSLMRTRQYLVFRCTS